MVSSGKSSQRRVTHPQLGDMQQLYPALRPCGVQDVYAELATLRSSPRVLMNVVTTIDGRATIGGSSHAIGSATDHLLMQKLRSVVDAVVVGAGTLRRESVSPGVAPPFRAERERAGLPPQPLTVVLGGEGELSLRGRIGRLGPERLVMFLPQGTDSLEVRDRATVHLYCGRRAEPEEVIRVLRERYGARTVLLEGGPSVYGSFARAGLVDEVFWTLSPKLSGGGDAPGMLEGPGSEGGPRTLRLVSVYEHLGELYLRYRAAPTEVFD